MNFDTLGLAPALLRALAENDYTIPTPIQEQAIPLILSGHDVLGGAQTGTGKTAAFALPMIQRLDPGGRAGQIGKLPRIRCAVLLDARAQIEKLPSKYKAVARWNANRKLGQAGWNTSRWRSPSGGASA